MKILHTGETKYYSFEFIQDDQMPEDKNVTCTFALVKTGDKVWLTKNHRGWELPGGHIEEGEAFDESLNREIQEETGVGVHSMKYFGYNKLTNFERHVGRDGKSYPFPHSYILYYICESDGEKKYDLCEDTLDSVLVSYQEAFEKMETESNKKMLEYLYNFNN